MENNDNGISLGQLFRVIFGRNRKRKITFFSVWFGVFLILLLSIKFIYNKSVDTYTAKFNWTVIGINDGKYVDGSTFDYKELQSEEVLTLVKEEDPKFSNINIENLCGNLTIEFVQKYDNTQKVVTDTYYLITVNKKMFESSEQAKLFVKSLANYPIRETIKRLNNVNVTSNFKSFDNAIIYDNQVLALSNQYNLLVQKYNELIEVYGENSVSSELEDLKSMLTLDSFTLLQTEINNYGYVKDFTYYDTTIKAQLADLVDTYKTNLYKIKSIRASRDALVLSASQTGIQDLQLQAYNDEDTKLIASNKEIIMQMIVNLRKLARNTKTYPTQSDLESEFREIASIIKSETDNDETNNGDTTLDYNHAFDFIYSSVRNGNVESFEEKLLEYYNKLKSSTNEFKGIQKNVISNNSKTSFYSGSVVELNEGMSIVKNLLLSLFIGLFIACMTNLIMDYKYLSEDKNKKE